MSVDYSPGAELDMAALDRADPDAYDVIVVFLAEADNDPKLIERFTTPGDGELGEWRYTIARWQAARRIANFFRIRVLDSPATSYRIVYGYDWFQHRCCVLAVVHKELFDYEPKSELGDRIVKDWREYTGGRKT